MAQFSCSAAQDLFYNDKDNIGQAIIILWPNTWKWYIFMALCHLIFQPPGLNVSLALSLFLFLIKRLSTCHFNLVFSLPESLSVSLVDPFTWQILSCPLQRAKGCTAAEHHLRWEACYLNPRSRVPCLPFSWVLTADPDWCSPHAEANSAVKRTYFPTLDSHFFFFFFSKRLFVCDQMCLPLCEWCYLRPAPFSSCSAWKRNLILRAIFRC